MNALGLIPMCRMKILSSCLPIIKLFIAYYSTFFPSRVPIRLLDNYIRLFKRIMKAIISMAFLMLIYIGQVKHLWKLPNFASITDSIKLNFCQF